MSLKLFNATILTAAIAMGSLPAFTIENHSSKEHTVTLQGAYRPASDNPKELLTPITTTEESEQLVIEANGSVSIDIEPCALLQVKVITTTTTTTDETTTTQERSSTSCYAPVSEEVISNDWGVVIADADSKPFHFSPDYKIEALTEDTLQEVPLETRVFSS